LQSRAIGADRVAVRKLEFGAGQRQNLKACIAKVFRYSRTYPTGGSGDKRGLFLQRNPRLDAALKNIPPGLEHLNTLFILKVDSAVVVSFVNQPKQLKMNGIEQTLR